MTTLHLMRWSAAIENWHRIHYDRPYAVEHDKLPDVLVSGYWKQQAANAQRLVWRRGLAVEDPLSVSRHGPRRRHADLLGQITDKYVRDGLGFVECDIGMRNQDDQETTPGTASPSCRCAGTAGALSICRTARISAECRILSAEGNHRWTQIHTDNLCPFVCICGFNLQGGSSQYFDP